MAFTQDNGLEIQTAGTADWNTGLGANFQLLEAGRRIALVADTAIDSGMVVTLNSSGWATLYNPHSIDLRPFAIAATSVLSGISGAFIREGRVRSMDVLSGHLTVGEPVFCSPSSIGFPVNSEAGALRPIGYALIEDGIDFQPFDMVDVTQEVTSIDVVVGSDHDFALTIGPRGTCRKLRVFGSSLDAYRVIFYSGSARVNSEIIYETITTSVDGGAQDFDVNTFDFVDAALFPFQNTDSASPAFIFGRISPQSASSVGSDSLGITFLAERF